MDYPFPLDDDIVTEVNSTQNSSNGVWLPPLYNSGLQNLVQKTLLGITVFGIVSNLSYMFVVIRIPRMRTITNFYLVNLSIADVMFLTAMTTNNLIIKYLIHEVTNPTGSCIAANTILAIPMNASIFTIALVATDRYIAVCHPMRSKTMNTKQHALRLIVSTWILASVFAVPLAVTCIVPSMTLFTAALFLQTGPFLLSMLTVIVLYVLIMRQMHKREASMSTKTLEIAAKKEKRQVVTVLIVTTFVFFGCVFPFQVKTCLEVFVLFGNPLPISFQAHQTLIYVTNILLFLNSAINPIIYKIFSSKYRLAVLEAFYCYRCIDGVPKPRRGSLSHSSTYSTERSAYHRVKTMNGRVRSGTNVTLL